MTSTAISSPSSLASSGNPFSGHSAPAHSHTQPMAALISLAIIGRDSAPIYCRAFDSSSSIQLSLLSHTALDLISDRIHSSKAPLDLYLGQLYSVEKYRVFGYLTNSKLKFIAITSLEAGSGSASAVSSSSAGQSESVRALLKEFHGLYIGYTMNPFVDLPFSPTAPHVKFDGQIDKLAKLFQERK